MIGQATSPRRRSQRSIRSFSTPRSRCRSATRDSTSASFAVAGVLRKQAGVREASSDLATKTARAIYDPDKTSPACLAQAVSDAGYPATARKP